MAASKQVECGSCNDKLPKNGDYATCSLCGYGLHLDANNCSGLKSKSWKSMGAANQAGWVCPLCRKQRKTSSNQVSNLEEDNKIDEVFDEGEVSSIAMQRVILEKINSLMDVKTKIDSIDASMKFLAEKYDALLLEVSELRSENKDLKKEVQSLKAAETANRIRTNELTSELAELDQYGRRVNLEIQGLPVEGELGNEKIDRVLEGVAKDIGVEYQANSIHQAHRLQARSNGKPPTIIVQFHSKTVRDLWLGKGRKAKLCRDRTKVFFNENICPKYRVLFREAKIRANTHHYSFVWFSGGRILVKKNEHTRNLIVIRDMDDLNKIK